MDLVNLFQTGGITLVFIGFNVWLVKFLLGVIKEKDDTFIRLVEKFDITVNVALDAIKDELKQHTEMLSKVCERIERDLNGQKKSNDN
jgi:hypothetical protein